MTNSPRLRLRQTISRAVFRAATPGKVMRAVAFDYLYKKHRVAAVLTVAAVLAFGALFGVAWSAGPLTVFHRLLHVHWIWVPIALGAEIVSYLGYVVAYREVDAGRGRNAGARSSPERPPRSRPGSASSSPRAASRSTRRC